MAGRATKDVKDLGGAFVQRTVVEDEHTYAVRIDDGEMLFAHAEIGQARAHLTDDTTEALASILGCEPDKLEKELDTLVARAKQSLMRLRRRAVRAAPCLG